ncbi:hypothetical protein KUF57_12400 [Mycolicibacterium sp. PAM1]|uniref:Uncharacterized protein n=1 Tax=Mycolicibacterium gilvum (strain PYR-GCK) TaxID=350054 RepID=A4TBL7_MYCGI|nr:hypothetical protein [Mycolicibacterium sp. PAM1]ABP45399.1 hypothetical protein Mflv_2922 [Mycolicibacterium gilvum PYR-GCK]MBV5244335.1 hypothetical protein [Mycolicibacterium sp. PAM1]
MEHQCPNLDCLAPPNEYCRHPNGFIKHIPCIARMTRADPLDTQLANVENMRRPIKRLTSGQEP